MPRDSMPAADRGTERRQALIALLLVLLPNLALSAVGLLMRGQARQVAASQKSARFGLSRLQRQLGLCVLLLLPTALWLWRRRAGWITVGWRRQGLRRAAAVGALLVVVTLFLRARPFSPEQLKTTASWWALATYAAVALTEEMLYRGFLQGRLADWVGRWPAYLATALLFVIVHIPARLLGGETLAQSSSYAAVRLLPMALYFGAAMLATQHVATPTLAHLAWNWASVLRGAG